MDDTQHKKIIEDMKNHVSSIIKEVVNGKIDRQTEMINKFTLSFYEASRNQVVAHEKMSEKFDEYIKNDMDWKERAEPVIQMGNNARGASKFVLYTSGIIIAVGGAWEVIRGLVRK